MLSVKTGFTVSCTKNSILPHIVVFKASKLHPFKFDQEYIIFKHLMAVFMLETLKSSRDDFNV